MKPSSSFTETAIDAPHLQGTAGSENGEAPSSSALSPQERKIDYGDRQEEWKKEEIPHGGGSGDRPKGHGGRRKKRRKRERAARERRERKRGERESIFALSCSLTSVPKIVMHNN